MIINRMLLLSVILCVMIIKINSEEINTDTKTYQEGTNNERVCNDKTLHSKVRTKRAKYYSYPSKFYRLPPMVNPIHGPFSITPPPKVIQKLSDTHSLPFKGGIKPPVDDGLKDEDIMNIVKYLSKSDLDKLLEFADDKKRTHKYLEQSYGRPSKRESYRERPLESERALENGWKIELSDTNTMRYTKDFSHPNTFDNTNVHIPNQDKNMMFRNPFTMQNYPNIRQTQTYISNSDQIGQNTAMAFLNAHISNEIVHDNAYQSSSLTGNYPKFSGEDLLRNPSNFRESHGTTSSDQLIRENLIEILPPPENLREDIEASYSSKVGKVVQPDSYALENFGALPLMSYDSKLDSVSSYYVPHYTVTSPAATTKQQSSPSQKPPPSPSDNERSEASLRAVKIWTHRSAGIAYTLNDDGTLSLEKKT